MMVMRTMMMMTMICALPRVLVATVVEFIRLSTKAKAYIFFSLGTRARTFLLHQLRLTCYCSIADVVSCGMYQ